MRDLGCGRGRDALANPVSLSPPELDRIHFIRMTLREELLELGRRLEAAGWQFSSPDIVRPEELRPHDEEALAQARELLDRNLPAFVEHFVLEVGMVCLLGEAAEGSPMAKAFPDACSATKMAKHAPLITIPLPTGVAELEMWIDEEMDELGIPLIEDADQAAGLSGGPPWCVYFDPAAPESMALLADLDLDLRADHDFEGYLRRVLEQGGVYTLPEDEKAAAFMRELGAGLGKF